jgi:KDO2-lipid IV(A) lauroyltransferase
MSVERAAMLGAKLMALLSPCMREKNEKIGQNLKLAFPEKQPGEIEALALRVWREFGQVLAEYPHLTTLSQVSNKPGSTPRVKIVGALEAIRRTDKPIVFVTAHLANWELAALAAKHVGLPLSVAYTPEKNWLIQGMIQGKRRALGCDCISTTEGWPPFVRALSKGRSLGFVADRRLKQGEMSPFFGIDTFIGLYPARLALKFGCELVPVRVERLRPGSYLVTVCEPVKPEASATDDRERAMQMVCRVNEIFESWIRERPDEWFCGKRMWPHPVNGVG